MALAPPEAQAALEPLLAEPGRSAVLCDIDGTLAPIVERPEEAHVSEEIARLLARLARRYRLVACISGRRASEARRLVGVGAIAYAGSHGAELLLPGGREPEVAAEFRSWEGRVHRFADSLPARELRLAQIRREDKGPIVAFHWRGARDERRALTMIEEIERRATAAGLAVHRGRKVLECRPPIEIGKHRAVRQLVTRFGFSRALFGGDDATDIDAFAELERLRAEGRLEQVVRVAVRSDEAPPDLYRCADVVVEGIGGFASLLRRLAEG